MKCHLFKRFVIQNPCFLWKVLSFNESNWFALNMQQSAVYKRYQCSYQAHVHVALNLIYLVVLF